MPQQQVVEPPYELFDTRVKQILDALNELTIGMYPVDNRIIIDEFAFAPNSTVATLTLQLQYPALIQSIIASIPGGTSGTLTIGASGRQRQFGIVAGQAPLNNIAMVVYPNDVFTLTITGGTGLVALEVMGLGLRNRNWRVL